jgi:2-polyprenyl-3-methyl-5-hydroxy-6-metoxy-1,4-benzoquinol methylase
VSPLAGEARERRIPVRDNTAGYFDLAAEKFDAFYEQESKSWLKQFIDSHLRKSMRERFERSFEVLTPLEGKSVLDVGCGSGRYSVICAELGAKFVNGVDFAPAMIEIASRIAAESGVAEKVEFTVADYLTHDCSTKFDAAIVMGVFDYVDDPAGFLRKIVSDVRGTVVASFPVRHDLWALQRKVRYRLFKRCPLYFYSASQIQELLDEVGVEDSNIMKLHRDFVVDFRTP